MNEVVAKDWISDRWGPTSVDRLTRFASMIADESARQNLISKSTLETIWQRHFLDSAQLVPLAEPADANRDWIDIGSGAGLPGVVAAILQSRPVRLVEPRRRRGEFLSSVVEALKLNATVDVTDVRTIRVATSPAVISARAVADLLTLMDMAARFADKETLLLFPKGRSGLLELEQVKQTWHGMFHVEHSLTALDSVVIVARGAKPK